MNPITDPSFELLISFMNRFFKTTNDFKERFRPMLYEANYKRGTRLLNYKQTQNNLWFLVKGLVREIHVDIDSLQEHTGWFWWESSVICADPGFFSQEPSEKTIEVLEDCRLISLTYQDWLLLKNDFTETETMTEKLRSFYARERQHFTEELLSKSAEERYLNHRAQLDNLFQRTQVKYLAEYLGMTADTLGRLRKLHMQ